jgi:ABC-2 type transport system ATP-binding protein
LFTLFDRQKELTTLNSVIYCRELKKYYGPKKVLQGINLEVPAGTVFALLGTNGSGKTTLIRTLLGLIPSSGGIVKVLGEEPYRIGAALRQKIGYVSEEQGLYGWMTIREIIDFCKSLYDQWDDRLVQQYIERFKLETRSRISTLSKGQTTKLALILALAPKPELLILDEPMSGLDPLAQHDFLQVIQKSIHSEGHSIFFSTHNLADVEAIARQVAIVYNGKIQISGPIAAVCQQVMKVSVPNGFANFSISRQVVLNQENDHQDILITTSEAQSLIANQTVGPAQVLPVSLPEAFLFFCAEETTNVTTTDYIC